MNDVTGANRMNIADEQPGDAWRARVQSLRDAFDRAFTEAPAAVASSAAPRFLGVRIAGDPFALRVADVGRLQTGGAVVPIPSPSPTLLGIASVRNALVAVHDLHLLLGYPAGGSRRFWVLVRREHPVGLAFDGLDGHFEADPTSPIEAAAGAGRHTRGATRSGASIRPIIDVASILGALARVTSGNDPSAVER
ncbi:MAG TPA: chemotaxis protein CheW [Polyangia bacterium]